MTGRFFGVVYLLIVLAAFIIVVTVARSASGAAFNQFVSIMERRFQIAPGQTKVWPDCGCTVRYMGTSVHGKVYSVQIEKLD